MLLDRAKASARGVVRRFARRGLAPMRTIGDMRRAHPDFDALVDRIRAAGTNSLSHFRNGYQHEGGLRLQQNPHELAALIFLLRERTPIRQYLEIGSASGGNGRFLYESVGFERFTSVDDGGHPDFPLQRDNFAHIPSFRQFLGDSHSDAAREYLVAQVPDHDIDVAFIDGDHSYEGVSQDIELARPFCGSGAWMIFHDTIACDGVERAWIDNVRQGMLTPVAEFIGDEVPLGIAVGRVD